MTDGKEYGIYLSPKEINYFPKDTVFPLFRRNGDVFSYQLGVHECPNLVKENGHMACKIYENRPLICRSFPVGCSDDERITVLFERCLLTEKSANDQWDMESFDACIQSMKEQINEANQTPRATDMFILNGRKWIQL